VEHLVAAGAHAGWRVLQGAAGRADGGGQERRLVEGQRVEILREEVPGRFRHAADGGGAVLAQVDRVQVDLEDLALGVAPLEIERQRDLARLAPPRAFAREEEAARELLGDGAGAAHDAALTQVADEGMARGEEIHADVAHEPAILRGQHGRHHRRRDAGYRGPRVGITEPHHGQVGVVGGELYVCRMGARRRR
jgi:hypothetical protein